MSAFVADELSVEEHLTLEQAAVRLQVDKSSVRRWISRGLIKNVRIFGHRTKRIPASSLNAFLKSRTV